MERLNKDMVCDVTKLSMASVRGEDFNEYKLGKFWHERPAIMIFLRNFACFACRSHALDVWEKREMYEKNGAQIYFIGNGSPSMIKNFKDDLKMPTAWIFTDPFLESFQAAGFKRGFLAAYGPRSILSSFKTQSQERQSTKWTKESGDVWQLGGVVVIRPGGVLSYQYISEYVGDYNTEPIPASS